MVIVIHEVKCPLCEDTFFIQDDWDGECACPYCHQNIGEDYAIKKVALHYPDNEIETEDVYEYVAKMEDILFRYFNEEYVKED